MPPANTSFPSTKSNISLQVPFLLALSHCPHGKVHVPNTELESRYLYWGPEPHQCFHLGDSLCQGPAGELVFLKKGAWERRKSMKTQPGGYSPYAPLDYRVELQHIAGVRKRYVCGFAVHSLVTATGGRGVPGS